MIACSGNGTATVMSTLAFTQSTSAVMPTVSVIQQPSSSADLYLCGTSNNATDPLGEGDGGGVQKASFETLEDHYKELNSRKIKDSLSSFLPDIPGEFDSIDSTDTKLRHLLDQRLIGNKEFHSLSGHALLGFRLLPGPLPEQYRIDPPSHEARSHHRKKKHKHRSIEKIGDEGTDLNPPSTKVKMPADAYSFAKSEPSSLLHSTPSPNVYSSPGPISVPKVGATGSHLSIAPSSVLTAGSMVGHDLFKKKKEKKKSKEKRKEKKEKKKKKHHNQDPPVGLPGPQPPSHPPPTYLHPSN